MDGSRFDSLARAMAAPTSRRGALKLILGAVAAGFAGTGGGTGSAAEQADKGDAGRRRPFWRRGKSCNSNAQCGALVPCTNGICTAIKCDIDGQEWEVGPKPGNECQYCLPERDPGVPDAWSYRPLGTNCSTFTGEVTGDPACLTESGYCNSDGECVPVPVADGTLCGPGQTCCGGICCTATQCCNEAGSCEECGPHCTIDGKPYPEGVSHPDGLCLICNSATEPFFWSTAPDDMSCGPNRIQVCCSGTCCGTGQCCDAERSCAIDECGPTCTIDGTKYAGGALNDDVPCQVCDPSNSTTAWSVVATNYPCGPSGNQVCCDGICCESGKCCGPSACSTDCRTCLINGVRYPDGAHNPQNLCEYCDAGLGSQNTAWTVNANNDLCGPLNDRVCCNGTCLGPGLCCSSDGSRVGGECNPDCTIDGVDYDEGDHPTPDNTCAICNPADPENWTLQPDNAPCGDTETQVCCAGDCCEPGECCGAEGTCIPCGCTIDEVVHASGTPNPNNPCEICDPALSTTAWTPVTGGSPCAASPDQVCCAGVCCAQGQCCNAAGQCESCAPGCTIDGVFYADGTRNPAEFCEVCNAAYPTEWSPRANPDCPPPCTIDGLLIANGTVNPTNPCEHCDGNTNDTSWSPSGAVVCGEAQDQACCNGACCNPGECCTADGVCGSDACDPEGCTIDGTPYPDGAVNPGNECQICSVAVSATTWSSGGFGGCRPDGDRFCAGGVCCDLGICPDHATDTCGDYCDAVCVIGGTRYFNGDRNPANGCEVCASTADHTAWLLVAPNYYCADTQEQVCCGGTCCPAGVGCNTSEGFVCDPDLDF